MSLKFASPLLGYNNNVRHKGRVFHIQTEDSGAKYGHVITHLFMDGGRILKSVKSSYAEYVGTERMADVVRELMKKQHRAMAVALRDGSFDRLAFGQGSASQETLALSANHSDPGHPGSGVLSSAPPVEAIAAMPPPAQALPVASPVRASSRPPWRASAQPPPAAAAYASDRSRVARASPEALDIGFPERPPSAPPEAPFARPSADSASLLLRERTAKGTYRLTPRPVDTSSLATTRPVAVRSSISGLAGGDGSSPGGAPVRAATTTRPASAFGQARPQGQSIFGEDLMSDKSLDEVILSYLAAELEGEKK
jgi:hypothetical protein